nr:PREDICTED: nucleoside diphosphate-linked moiety X motif 19, mitochondrial-like isoform X2 [Linepithema humile]
MKAWRESASLILAARHGEKYNHTVSPAIHNYNLLFLKRHQKSHAFPSSYVFPGGTVHPADSDMKWHDFFAAFGFDNGFASLIPKNAERPSIFRSKENELPKEISLRITAIRETFEECGILMCKHKKDSHISSNWAQYMPISKDELQTWQNKVHNNATEFFTLCEKLECYPDLWALYEWNNWLSPTMYEPKQRFDTVFYLACMPSIPYTEYETSEIEDLKWVTPENFFSSLASIKLPPPQCYEIATLNKIKNVDTVLDLAMKRNKKGVYTCEGWIDIYFARRYNVSKGS